MGMFDSLWVRCPNCNTKVEFQSKSGECGLYDYDVHNVPASIAGDVDGQSMQCPGCKSYVKLKTITIIHAAIT